jgi:hypothetical protein
MAAEATLTGVDLPRRPARRMSRDEIRIVVDALGGLLVLLREADPAE